MVHFRSARWAALLTLAALGAAAQAQPVAATPPAPAPYRSDLKGYIPFDEQKLLAWKEANDTVGRVGGWKAYAREAQGAGTDPAGAPAAADPHAGHAEKSK